MKVPFSWLKEFLDLSLSPEEIAETLTLAGIEVEKIEPFLPSFSGVVAAQILVVRPHPNAEKLCIAEVSDGNETVQVVCGDLSCRIGQKTALAKIGASLKDDKGKPWLIKKGKLRDVESYGMLCAEKDLGLSDHYDTIIHLPEDTILGTDLAVLYTDVLFEISLTPNLGHCMSVIGIARELGALLNLPIKQNPSSLKENSSLSTRENISIHVEDKELCPFYSVRFVENVSVGPSPGWLRRRLEMCGLRSVNNVVDCANLVMLECGQPLHLFDYDTITGKKITVTSKKTHAFLTALDQKTYEVPKEALLICDEEKPLAFAGIIGSLDSSVMPHTKRLLIEAAIFLPSSIRKTAKQLGIKTDASQRFERGIDPLAVTIALDKTAELIRQTASGSVATGKVEQVSCLFHPKVLSCRMGRVNRLLGTHLSLGEISFLLQRLQIKTVKEEKETLHLEIPSYRNDLHQEVDLIEEIGRIYGFNNIPKKQPRYSSGSMTDAPLFMFENTMRARLISEGLQECLTCDLISPKLASLTAEREMQEGGLISVLHPCSVDQSILRASLLGGLLETVRFNYDRQSRNLSLFEIGRIHFRQQNHYREFSTAGILLTGEKAPYAWDVKSEEVDFFDLKGIVENIFAFFDIKKLVFEPSHLQNFHPLRQARLKREDVSLGVMGEVHPAHLKSLGIEQKVFFAELNLHDLLSLEVKSQVTPISPYPGSQRDWTLTVKEEISLEHLLKAVEEIPSRFLEKVSLLGLYTSSQIGKGNKNITLRFFYRDKEKTIAMETVEQEHTKITQEVAKKFAIYPNNFKNGEYAKEAP